MLTVENIKKAIDGTEFWHYGLRVDEGIRYNIGDTANNSHQLFQDPEYDEGGELIYPYIEDGVNKGLYDVGELDGTCTIGFDAEDGNDRGEIIIRDAEVLGAYDR